MPNMGLVIPLAAKSSAIRTGPGRAVPCRSVPLRIGRRHRTCRAACVQAFSGLFAAIAAMAASAALRSAATRWALGRSPTCLT